MKRVVRNSTVLGRTEGAGLDEVEAEFRHRHDAARSDAQQPAEQFYVGRPVGEDFRLRIMAEIHGDGMRRLFAAHGWELQGIGDLAEIRDDVAFDPGLDRVGAVEGQV